MPRPINLGNGELLIGLDHHALVRDVYYPFVGLENQTGGHYIHKIGVWVDGQFSWLDDGSWQFKINYLPETLVSDIKAENPGLKIGLDFTDTVYNERNVFLRKVILKNLSDSNRQIKIFFNQQFELYQAHGGDSAYYDPINKVIVHYKGRRVMLINALRGKRSFDDYSVGLFGIEGKEGTYKDAEDGVLTKNPIEHGTVDSIIGLAGDLAPHQSDNIYYWMIASHFIKDAVQFNEYILARTPPALIKSSRDYWKAWVNRQQFSFFGLEPEFVDLFKKSLLTLRSHTDNRGGLIASGDSDLLKYGRDTYSYVWPRDCAFCIMALNAAGDFTSTHRFFEFANHILTDGGYFMHKYRPDESLGASWHPWVRDNQTQLPIQEDETAEVLVALWDYYKLSRDLEFIESIYNSFIRKSADFLVSYREPATGLPRESYDLWEEKFGVFTFTAASVYGALNAAARFAALLGKTESERKYLDAAAEIKTAIMKYLYNPASKTFFKRVYYQGKELISDPTIDMSAPHGIFKFQVLDFDDPLLKTSFEITASKLTAPTPTGGLARYEGDNYFRVTDVTPNPWIITSLWLAQFQISQAKSEADLAPVKTWLSWVVKNAGESGTLSEQLDPYSAAQISATPLAWSHAEYVVTVIKYLQKLEDLGICVACVPVK